MVKLNRDSIAGLVLLAFSLILAFYLTPNHVESHGSVPAALSPRLFCYLTSGLLGMLSIMLIATSLKNSGRNGTGTIRYSSWEPITRGLICTVVACVYIAMSGYIGFFASTALAMIIFLVYFGVKKWWGILLFLIVLLGFIYLLFVQALKVNMPDGILF
ncbi:tripartite tricarboxylate transporter TctB family protein [Desulfotignum balticum]|uniref:tripartite tricarboxylate transporter TctB family protein n=1 Tax=Desulfotignum balticum TaxID=115781 RepID=UPI0004089C7E|nr:tripartite tricarboxylate transporter TctB family protein [Desulfotignum balticum]